MSPKKKTAASPKPSKPGPPKIDDPQTEVIKEMSNPAQGVLIADAVPFAPNPEVDRAKTASKPKLVVTLREDGAPDFESMRTETRNRLKEVLKDPQTQQLLGVDQQQLPEIFTDQDIELLFGLVGTIEAFIFSMAGHVDMDIAQRNALWNPKEVGLVMGPTKNVLAKNMSADSFLFRWKDEIVLSALLLMISRGKYQNAMREQLARNEAKKQANPATQRVEPPATAVSPDGSFGRQTDPVI